MTIEKTAHEPDSPRAIHPQETPTRRDVLIGTGLAIGALALPAASFQPGVARADHGNNAGRPEAKAEPYKFGGDPRRVRKSFYDLSEGEVSLLCDAVGAMRDGVIGQLLGVENPLQWDEWVMVHALHCTQQSQGWRQVHWGWLFLPWHRAYLFFLERMLSQVITKVLGEDGSKFALPYWDWEFHKGVPNTKYRTDKKITSPFFGFDLEVDTLDDRRKRGKVELRSNLALWDGYRFPSIAKPEMDPNNEKSSLTNTWRQHTASTIHATSPASIADMLGYPEFEVFGGQPNNNPADPRGQGLLESLPHNLVHDWVGSRYGDNRDMGYLRYASIDPIFNLHHANIDRIWTLYKDQSGRPIEPGDSATWHEQWFNFVDVDGKTKSVTVKDTVRQMTNVAYQEPQERGPRDTHRKLLATATLLPREPRRGQSLTVVEIPKTTRGEPIDLTPAPRQESYAALHARASDAPTRSLLEFELADLKYGGKFYVRVFINKDDADVRTSIDDEHFVGLFGGLDSHAGHDVGEANATTIFRVPLARSVSNFYKVAPRGTPFKIRLVPVGPSGQFSFTVQKVTLKVY